MEDLIPGKGLVMVEVATETQTRSGLIVPKTDRKGSETYRGTVLKVGKPKEGVECEAVPGDEVLFHPPAAIEAIHENRLLYFVGQEDIVAIVKTHHAKNGQLVGV